MARADRVTLIYRASLESGTGKSLPGDRGKVDEKRVRLTVRLTENKEVEVEEEEAGFNQLPKRRTCDKAGKLCVPWRHAY